jgi:hypothetical protein
VLLNVMHLASSMAGPGAKENKELLADELHGG